MKKASLVSLTIRTSNVISVDETLYSESEKNVSKCYEHTSMEITNSKQKQHTPISVLI